MARHGQALSASRTPAFSYAPHDLILVTTPGTKFYSPTIDDPISDGDVLDIASRGVLQAIRVRKTAGGDVVTMGRQRTKRALVVNALMGIAPYRGSIASVAEAIARLRGSDVGDRIVEIAARKFPLGIMVRAFAHNNGTDADAEADGIAEDEIRRGGSGSSWAVRVARARQLIDAGGYTVEQAAATMQGVTVAALKRRLKADPSAPPVERKGRGKSTRPSAKVLKKLVGSEAFKELRNEAFIALGWAAGTIDTDQFLAEFPELKAEVAP